MPTTKKSMSEIMALGFQEGYNQAIQEFLQGHAEGFAMGFYGDSEADSITIKQGRMFELAFAEGFLAGNCAAQLNITIDQGSLADEPNKAEFGGDDYAGEEENDDYPDIGDERSQDPLWMDT